MVKGASDTEPANFGCHMTVALGVPIFKILDICQKSEDFSFCPFSDIYQASTKIQKQTPFSVTWLWKSAKFIDEFLIEIVTFNI